MTGRLLRLWQRTGLWSVGLEGKIIWWSSDDVHYRERKVDIEIGFPRWIWRPYCWWRGKHDPYYSACVYCRAVLSRKDGR